MPVVFRTFSPECEEFHDGKIFMTRKRAPTRITRDTCRFTICEKHRIVYFVKVNWVKAGEEWIAVQQAGVTIPRCVDYIEFGDVFGILSGSAASPP